MAKRRSHTAPSGASPATRRREHAGEVWTVEGAQAATTERQKREEARIARRTSGMSTAVAALWVAADKEEKRVARVAARAKARQAEQARTEAVEAAQERKERRNAADHPVASTPPPRARASRTVRVEVEGVEGGWVDVGAESIAELLLVDTEEDDHEPAANASGLRTRLSQRHLDEWAKNDFKLGKKEKKLMTRARRDFRAWVALDKVKMAEADAAGGGRLEYTILRWGKEMVVWAGWLHEEESEAHFRARQAECLAGLACCHLHSHSRGGAFHALNYWFAGEGFNSMFKSDHGKPLLLLLLLLLLLHSHYSHCHPPRSRCPLLLRCVSDRPGNARHDTLF